MTMPIGTTEEPTVQVYAQPSTPVHVVSSDAVPERSPAAEHGYWRTFLITSAVGADVATPGAKRIAGRNLRRRRLLFSVYSGGNVVPTVAGFPSVAVSGTAVQNPFNYPVQVVLSGFTATQVFVNGILVGASNGTYFVPAYGSLSVTFTVLGTTTATGIAQPQTNLDGVIVGNRDFIANSDQAARSPYVAGSGGGFWPIGTALRWEVQQELWACFPVSNSGPVIVTVSDEAYASGPASWKANLDR